MLLTGLLLAVVAFVWGAHAVVPWRLRRAAPAPESDGGDPNSGPNSGPNIGSNIGRNMGRTRWAYAALPALWTGVLAGLLYVREQPDAALAAGLLPITTQLAGRLLGLGLAAALAVDLLILVGRRRLEDAGWVIAACFGLLLAAVGSFAAELMRIGEGPGGPTAVLLVAAACRLALLLAAGEAVAPGRFLFAPIAGAALPLYLLLLPEEVRQPFFAGGAWITLAAAALLLLTCRWFPARLRRIGLAAAVFLASLAFAQAADLSAGLAGQPLPPLPPLAVP